MGSLAMFPVIYSTMGTIAGITHRVGQLLQALEELEVCCWCCEGTGCAVCSILERVAHPHPPLHDPLPLYQTPPYVQAASKRIATAYSFQASPGVGLTGVTCRTPGGDTLFNNLTFFVQPRQRLLIMGPSGVGKSSLLRIIAGLWPVQHTATFCLDYGCREWCSE